MAIKDDKLKKKVFTNVHGGVTGGVADRQKATVRMGGTPQQDKAAAMKKKFMDAGAGTQGPQRNRPTMGGAAKTGLAPQLGGAGGMAASNRMAQIQKLMPQKKPELISYETNPNMDWRQAAALNQTAMRGHTDERQVIMNQMGGMGRADVTGAHGMDQTVQRGANQMATTKQIGANRIAQIGARGEQNRETQGQALNLGQKNALELGEQKNIYDKEADNRNFVTRAVVGGAPMDAKLQNAYNTPGAFDTDIQGVQMPQQQPDSGIGFMRVGGGVDKKGNKLPDRIMRTNDRSGEVSPTAPAPQSALQMLQQDPDAYLDSFIEKYGYLPDGYGQ